MAEDIKNGASVSTETKPETTEAPMSVKDLEAKVKELKAQQEKANQLISKANSEAADWKRKYTSTLDEAKAAALKAEEDRKAELAELETLRHEKRVSTYAKKLMEAGFDGATADQMANSLPDGVADTYFESLKLFNEKKSQEYAAKQIDSQKGLSVGLPITPADAQKERTNKLRGYAGLPPLP